MFKLIKDFCKNEHKLDYRSISHLARIVGFQMDYRWRRSLVHKWRRFEQVEEPGVNLGKADMAGYSKHFEEGIDYSRCWCLELKNPIIPKFVIRILIAHHRASLIELFFQDWCRVMILRFVLKMVNNVWKIDQSKRPIFEYLFWKALFDIRHCSVIKFRRIIQ